MSLPWLTVLTTKSRPQYLAGTLDALDGNGRGWAFPGRKMVVFDGGGEGWSRLGWENRNVSREPGTVVQSARALHYIMGAAFWGGAPYLLYFEDDVFVCRDAVLAMSEMEVPDKVAFLTFCNQKVGCDHVWPHVQARRADEPLNSPGHWGSQAMKVPRRTLEIVAKAASPTCGFSSDAWFGAAVASGDTRYGIVLPSLVRHTGKVSTIPDQRGQPWAGHRLGLNYAGDDADGLAIVREIADRVKLWPEEER